MSESKKLISIVVPVFNEEENVEALHRAVAPIFDQLADRYEFELIFTDNHSTDKTFEKLKSLWEKEKRISAYRFSKNFGYQKSILTGYLHAKGEAVIQLDCDLQDPPSMIPQFLEKWESGYQVVYGVRKSRKESWLITIIRKIFYRLINMLSEDELPLDAGDFRLVDRALIDEMRKTQDVFPYLRGMITQIGFSQVGIAYDRAPRQHGESKFGFRQMLRLGIDGLLHHSTFPLRFSIYFGFAIAVLTLLGSLTYTIVKLNAENEWPAGFATITILILVSIAVNSVFLGIIGEYVGRIYHQQKKFPLTIIEDELVHK